VGVCGMPFSLSKVTDEVWALAVKLPTVAIMPQTLWSHDHPSIVGGSERCRKQRCGEIFLP
jgi:hypothetical protein